MSYKDHEKVGLVERNKNFLWIVLKVLKLDHNPVPALASSYPTIFTTKTCFLPSTNGSLFLLGSARRKKVDQSQFVSFAMAGHGRGERSFFLLKNGYQELLVF